MIESKRVRSVVFCLCCAAVAPALAAPDKVEQPTPTVVRTLEQWQAALASGKKTPLDALTPYGKRRFTRGLMWGSNGLGGFRTAPLVRELGVEQIAAVLAFLDSASYLPMLTAELVGAPTRMPEPSPDVEHRLEQLEQFVTSEAHQRRSAPVSATTSSASSLLRRYRDLFGDRINQQSLKAVAPGDLQVLFDAAALVSFDSPGGPGSREMRMVHREMVARGIDTRRTFDSVVLTDLIAAREFEKAREFVALKPDLPPPVIPKLVDPLGAGFSGRTLLHYDAESNTLTRRAAPYPDGAELVMVIGAGCHFSQDALEALRQDANLQVKLRKANLVLVIQPNAAIPFRFMTEWNVANPALPIRVPYSVGEWPAIADGPGVPAFYLLKNGTLIGQLDSGWPAGGNKADLIKLLDTANM